MLVTAEKFYTARVKFRRQVAPDLWILRLDPGGEFKFNPGQYATLGLRVGDRLIERAYSIASAPHEPEIEFFLELVPEGRLTPLLFALEIGAELTLRKTARGRFTLDLAGGHPNHLLLCTVTGIAPFISYVRTLCADWSADRSPHGLHLYLIQGASRSWEFGYREELESIASRVSWLTYIPTVSRANEDSAWNGERGRADDIIRKYTDAWHLTPANTTAYLCGHPKMAENGTSILKRIGFAKESLRQEVYWVPKDAACK
jgi:ferredoxin--NADP+ reductase